MKTRKAVVTLFILGALLLSTVMPVLGAPSLDDGLTVSITYEVTPCDYLEVTFTGSVEEGTEPYTFDWEFGDGNIATGETVTHPYEAGGTYTVTLTVTDSAEETATAEETLTLLDSLEASASADPTLTEPEEEITFAGTAAGGQEPYTFFWDFGDGNSDTGETVTHAYSETGIYDVTLTVTDDNGCTAEDTVRVAAGESSEHTLSNLIALFFTLPPEYIDALRAEGWGYGEIAMAYFMAQLSGEDVEVIIALREEGNGWGEIRRETLGFAGLHGYNLGLIVSGREAPAHLQNLADYCEMEVHSLTELLQETGAKFGTVRMACRLAQQLEDEEVTVESIIEMHQEGMNWREIRVELGLVSPGVKALAARCGMEDDIEGLLMLIEEWGQGTINHACQLSRQAEVPIEEVLDLLEGGMNWQEIKEALGLVPERGRKEQDSQGQGHGKGKQGQPQGKGKGPKH